MLERMKKSDIINLIEGLDIDYEEFWILSTSALVIRGVFEDAQDLDIAITEKGLKDLKKKHNLVLKENGWYKVNERIECVLDTKEAWKIEKFGKYNLESLEKYFEYLDRTKRDKDKIKYEIVKDLLNKRNK